LEIKQHLYFKGINWKDVYDKKIPVPFKPTVVILEPTIERYLGFIKF
jgi:hypothetical protein